MGLKVKIDSLEGLDENLRGLYKEVDGMFILDVSDIDNHPKINTLSKTMREERDARKKYEKALKSLQNKTDGLDLDKIKDLDPEKYQQMLSDLEQIETEKKKLERKKLRDKEAWEKLEEQIKQEAADSITDAQDKHTQELKVYQDKITEITKSNDDKVNRMYSVLEKQLKDKEIVSALAAAEGNIPILMPHVSKHVQIIEDTDTGDFSARVVDGEGTVRINDQGQPLSISEFVSELREKPEFQGDGIFKKQTKDGGSGSQSNNGGGGDTSDNPFSKEHFNLTKQLDLKVNDPAEYDRLKKLAAGKG